MKCYFICFDDGIPADVLKEMSILKCVEHPNIMRLRDVERIPPLEIKRGGKSKHGDNLPGFGLVFDLARTDLHHYSDEMNRTDRTMLMKKCKVSNREHVWSYEWTVHKQQETRDRVQVIMYQLVDGMHYMHSRGFLHRDLKPINILIGKEGQILIADFGLAISHKYTDTLDLNVATPNFRAPEIALGKSTYSFASDVWAVGCIFAQLFLGDFLMKARYDSDVSLLLNNEWLVDEIERVLGNFDDDPASVNYFPGLEDFSCYRRRIYQARNRRHLFDAFDVKHEKLLSPRVIGTDAAELMRRMLTVDPAKRITFREAKEHPWFADRDASLRL